MQSKTLNPAQKRAQLQSLVKKEMLATGNGFDEAFRTVCLLNPELTDSAEPQLSYNGERNASLANDDDGGEAPGIAFQKLVRKNMSDLNIASYSFAWNLTARSPEGQALLAQMHQPEQDQTVHQFTENFPGKGPIAGQRSGVPAPKVPVGPMADIKNPRLPGGRM